MEVSDADWNVLLACIQGQRLTGLATAAAHAKHLLLTDQQRQSLRDLQISAMAWSLTVERSMLEIAAAARDEGIDHIVLKGPALAHCVYPDASWRSFRDLDLIVRGSDWRRACSLLDRHGYHRELPEPWPGFDTRFGKAAAHQDVRGVQVDLHRTLVVGPFGLWMEPTHLFDRTRPFEVAGQNLLRLDDTSLLLHACMHASLGWRPPLLQPLRDVAQVVAAGEVDWDAFASLASSWKLNAVVVHAFATVRDVLQIDPPPELKETLGSKIPRVQRRALATYVTAKRTRGGIALSTLRAIPGLRSKAAYLRGMLAPGPAFVAARSGGSTGSRSYLRRWAIPVRWMLRRSRS